MAVPSISTYSISNGSHRYGSIGGAAVMTSPSDSVTKVSAIISQTSGGAAIETVETTVKTSSDQFADRWALSWHTTGITSSPYYVTMWATNADGNGPTREVAPYIYFPPTVAITAPANGSTLASASVTMAWTASDPYGISAQRVTVLHGASVLLDEAVGESDTSYAVPSSVAFLDGESYTFRVTARNGNGMEASADSTVAFSFDAPAAASVTITDDGATATITVDDPHYSESGSTIAVDGSAIADSFTVFGNSTQDGTPSPSSPVEIRSVEPTNVLPTPYKDGTKTVSGVTFTPNEDGTITASGTATGNGYYVLFGGFANVEPLPSWLIKGETYTMYNGRADGANDHGTMMVYFYNGSSTVGTYVQRTNATFTVPSTATHVGIFLRVLNGNALNYTFSPRINRGTLTLPYSPYGALGVFIEDADNATTTYPIDLQGNSLRSLPDGTRDELRVGERVTLVKRVGCVVYDGSEAWTLYTASSYGEDFYTAKPQDCPSSVYGSRVTSNIAAGSGGNYTAQDKVNISSGGNVNFAAGRTLGIQSVPDWKTWLASNNVTLLYPLTTPQEIDLGAVSDLPFIPEDGEMWVDGTTMEAVLRPADYAGQPTISSVDIARVNPDGTWTLAQGVTEGQSAIDPLPPLGVAYRYALTSHAAGGGTKVAYAEHIVETRAWHLNFGDAAQEHVSYLYNPQATMTLAQGGESYHFADGGAGRGLPVFYPTTDRDMSGTLRFDTVLYGDSDILLDLCDRYPVAWLRDPFGHRWRAHVRPSVSHGTGQVWPVTIAWDAVRFEEV